MNIPNREMEDLIFQEVQMIRSARENLIDFITFTKPDYIVNWHHRVIAETLERWAFGDIDKLMVFTAPRHGKSELVSRRLPAFIFGKRPDAKIIGTSYGADLAEMINRDIQRIIEGPDYADIFPETKLYSDLTSHLTNRHWLKKGDIFQIINREGIYKCAGVGGAITGIGGDYIIIDDPVKNHEEAASETIREKMWNWYTSTLYTRLERNGKMLLTMTRWHEDDLAGRILDSEEGEWHVLSLPALLEAEDEKDPRDIRALGEALWEWKYNRERLEAMRKNIGTRYWNALYQQRPSAKDGETYKRENWLYYDELPKHFDKVIMVWDMTFKKTNTGSFVCGQVWGRCGKKAYLIDQFRDRIGFVKTIEAFLAMSAKHPKVTKKWVEDKANGEAILDALKGHQHGVEPYTPRGSKEARAEAVAYIQEYKSAYLPNPDTHPWVKAYIDELASFPNGKYNDQVDATSMAWEILFIGSGVNRLETLLTGFDSMGSI